MSIFKNSMCTQKQVVGYLLFFSEYVIKLVRVEHEFEEKQNTHNRTAATNTNCTNRLTHTHLVIKNVKNLFFYQSSSRTDRDWLKCAHIHFMMCSQLRTHTHRQFSFQHFKYLYIVVKCLTTNSRKWGRRHDKFFFI